MPVTDLIAGIRSREELVAVATASAMLTKAQTKLFAQIAAGSNPIALENAMLATQPRGARGGPLVPYLIMGAQHEVGTMMDDVAKLLLAVYTADPNTLKQWFAAIPDLLSGRGAPISVGAQSFYANEQATAANVLSPFHLHQRLATVGMNTVLSWQGINEEDLACGYTGTTELKGNMPSTVHPAWQGASALRTPAPDAASSSAAAAAQGLAERVK